MNDPHRPLGRDPGRYETQLEISDLPLRSQIANSNREGRLQFVDVLDNGRGRH